MSSTRYRPYHEDGRVGPICEFMCAAHAWMIFERPEDTLLKDWDVRLISTEPTLQEIQDRLPANDPSF